MWACAEAKYYDFLAGMQTKDDRRNNDNREQYKTAKILPLITNINKNNSSQKYEKLVIFIIILDIHLTNIFV